MSVVHICASSAVASDSWGFVGTVHLGEIEAYRTLESFVTPHEAEDRAVDVLAAALGELIAAEEWRRMRQSTGSSPTRHDFSIGRLQSRPRVD